MCNYQVWIHCYLTYNMCTCTHIDCVICVPRYLHVLEIQSSVCSLGWFTLCTLNSAVYVHVAIVGLSISKLLHGMWNMWVIWLCHSTVTRTTPPLWYMYQLLGLMWSAIDQWACMCVGDMFEQWGDCPLDTTHVRVHHWVICSLSRDTCLNWLKVGWKVVAHCEFDEECCWFDVHTFHCW